MNFWASLQKYIQYGYLYLILLGISKECIYYYFAGINILKFSNLIDIIISPISALTSDPSMLLTSLFAVIIMYVITVYFSKNYHKSWVKGIIKQNIDFDSLDPKERTVFFENFFIRSAALCFLGFFVGNGLGDGFDLAEEIRKKEPAYNYVLTYNSSDKKLIYLIGTNSMNYFFIEKGNPNIIISPIGGVRSLENLGVKKSKK
jgi:hypothetical protein